MNEVLFLAQTAAIIAFTLIALKMGKEALIAWISFEGVLANLFVLKQVELFGLEVTCSDAFAIGTLASLNLLQHHFGKESAKKAIWISFACMVFFALLSKIHLLYLPSERDYAHAAYAALLSPAPRLLFASLATFLLVQYLDVHLFRRLPLPSATLRNACSLSLSQACDTALFSFLGLYGYVHSLSSIMLLSFVLKLLLIALFTPLTALSRRIV